MTDTEKKILDLIGQAVPKMDGVTKSELAAFLEGVAFATQYIAGKEAAS